MYRPQGNYIDKDAKRLPMLDKNLKVRSQLLLNAFVKYTCRRDERHVRLVASKEQ